jgi:hypothetical protein
MPATTIIHGRFSARALENATSMAELIRAPHGMRTLVTALALMSSAAPVALAQDPTNAASTYTRACSRATPGVDFTGWRAQPRRAD